ncbi:MAG: penicillin-binding protein 1A [Gammaproteobacteria bacterium]|jgi:penicillin-binding protein 1A
MKFTVNIMRLGLIAAAGMALIGLLTAGGLYLYISPQLPSADTLRDVRYQVPLRVYSRDGKLLSEYGEMRRSPVKLSEVPDLMVKAVLAAEDDRFYEHPGVDYQGLLRAAWHLVTTGRKTQGGSTITMQVARNFFLGREKTYLRKFTEILLSLKIEHEFTKQDILQLYLNKIYLGQRAYGIAAAAQVYYGVELSKLSLPQMAMIAGLPKAPSRYNPIADPPRALERRNYVLGRMRALGFISEQDYRTALATQDDATLHSLTIQAEAPYLGEMVRAEVVKRYGEDAYTAGYKVYTTVDSRLQTAANTALRDALLDYDRRHGYRGPESQVNLAPEAGPDEWSAALANRDPVGTLPAGLVIKVEKTDVQVFLKDQSTITIPWQGLEWARPYINDKYVGKPPQTAADIVKPGDIIRVQHQPDGQWRLAQIPRVEGALVSLRPSDGSVIALVGGFDFFKSKFNRVIQASRQPGSSFKPFVYSAALNQGMTPATLINDAPVVFDDPSLEDTWRPENYSGRFFGPTRLREALVHSRNLVSIRILRAIGIDSTIDYVSRFGFDKHALPHNLSLALGSGVVTPMDLATGYTVFANTGYRVKPYFIDHIEDINGKVLETTTPDTVCKGCGKLPPDQAEPQHIAPRVITAQNAYLMTSMMRDVIRHGTGRKARVLGRNDIAGKTGTTNDQRDAWFAGFNPEVVTVAWVGFDDTHTLGYAETGARAALPMWIDYMRAALRDIPDHSFERPPGLVTVRIDPKTGLLADSKDRKAIFETFLADHVPTRESGSATTDVGGKQGKTPTIPEQLF